MCKVPTVEYIHATDKWGTLQICPKLYIFAFPAQAQDVTTYRHLDVKMRMFFFSNTGFLH